MVKLMWEPAFETFERMLGGWKRYYLSKWRVIASIANYSNFCLFTYQFTPFVFGSIQFAGMQKWLLFQNEVYDFKNHLVKSEVDTPPLCVIGDL